LKAKEYLRQIKTMDAKINTDIEELASLEALATKTTSVLGDERVQSSGSQQKMADAVVKIADLRNSINEQIDRFIDFKEEVKNLLFESCDSECISLLYKRYFQDKKWEEIAVEMKYTFKWVSGGLHQRALSQVQKALDAKEGVKNDV
jgi:hypothetical protein